MYTIEEIPITEQKIINRVVVTYRHKYIINCINCHKWVFFKLIEPYRCPHCDFLLPRIKQLINNKIDLLLYHTKDHTKNKV